MGVRDNWMVATYQKGPNFKIKGRIQRLKNPVQVYDGLLRQDLILGVASGPARGEDITPQLLLFEFHNDDTAVLSKLEVGQEVEVGFILQGRTSTKTGITHHFVALQGFAVYPLDELGMPIFPDTPGTIRLDRLNDFGTEPPVFPAGPSSEPTLPN